MKKLWIGFWVLAILYGDVFSKYCSTLADNIDELQLYENEDLYYPDPSFAITRAFRTKKYDAVQACKDISFNYMSDSLVVLETFKTKKSIISVVRDTARKKTFFVKQMQKTSAWAQMELVREVVASTIARTAMKRVQKVILIPVDMYVPGKVYPDQLATVHVRVPGIPVKKSKFSFLEIRLRASQQWPADQRGLTYSIIKQLTLHAQLPCISAIDTFVAISDRHNNNFFYEENKSKNGQFHMIDMGCSFNKDIAALTLTRLRELRDQGIQLTPEEYKVLRVYAKTLRVLIEHNPPKKVHELFDFFWSEAVVYPQWLYEKEIQKKYKYYKEKYLDTYESTLELLMYLSQWTSSF